MAKTYTTVQGDMWDSIAYTQMGSTDNTHRLLNLNRKNRMYYTLPAGIVLILPELEKNILDTLPPWKRGVQ